MSNIVKSRRFCLQLLRSATTIVATLLTLSWLQQLPVKSEPSNTVAGSVSNITNTPIANTTGTTDVADVQDAPKTSVAIASPISQKSTEKPPADAAPVQLAPAHVESRGETRSKAQSEDELIQQMAGRLVRRATAVARTPEPERPLLAAASVPLAQERSKISSASTSVATPLPPKTLPAQAMGQPRLLAQQPEMVFNAPPPLPALNYAAPYYANPPYYANQPYYANPPIGAGYFPAQFAQPAFLPQQPFPQNLPTAFPTVLPMGGPATPVATPGIMMPPQMAMAAPMGYAAPQVYIPYNVTPTAGYISAVTPQMVTPQMVAPQMVAPQMVAPQNAYGLPGMMPYGNMPYTAMMPAPLPYTALPPMPSPYAALQSPYGAPRLTPPVARMRSSAPMLAQQFATPTAPSVMPQYGQPIYQQYAQPQYGQPQYGQPQYGQPQYGQPQPAYPPQYGQQPYIQPQYAQPQYGQQYGQPLQPPQYIPAPAVQPIPQMGSYGQQIIANPLNAPLAVPTTKVGLPAPSTEAAPLKTDDRGGLKSTALTRPSLTLQGVYQYQADDNSARARLSANYPLSPRFLFGATFDVSTGNGFSDSPNSGLNVNELFFATSIPEIPSLRFAVGQLDMTSYFDRNSFAKDGASHFFNPTFQTNNALAAAGLGSRPGLLVNWSLSDNIEAKAAAFSSSRGLSEFSLNAFAGELGIRYGNAIFRGTYVTGRDSGNRDSFREAFLVDRGNNQFGLLKDDRESAFGLNGEVFIPKYKMGVFARYGRYNNLDAGESGDTYGGGVSFLDIFSTDDRLGVAYGSALTNERLRRQAGNRKADALEVFYDFRFLPNLRLGFSLQQRNDFSEIVAGVRVKTEFDVTPKGRLFQ